MTRAKFSIQFETKWAIYLALNYLPAVAVRKWINGKFNYNNRRWRTCDFVVGFIRYHFIVLHLPASNISHCILTNRFPYECLAFHLHTLTSYSAWYATGNCNTVQKSENFRLWFYETHEVYWHLTILCANNFLLNPKAFFKVTY